LFPHENDPPRVPVNAILQQVLFFVTLAMCPGIVQVLSAVERSELLTIKTKNRLLAASARKTNQFNLPVWRIGRKALAKKNMPDRRVILPGTIYCDTWVTD